FPIVIVSLLFHDDILKVLFGEGGFGERTQLLSAISVAIIAGFPHIFVLGTLVRIFQFRSRLKEVLYHFGVAIVVYVTLAVLCAKLFGAVGLAAAYTITLNLLAAVMFFELMRLDKGRIFDREFWSICLAGMSALLITYLLAPWIGARDSLTSVVL